MRRKKNRADYVNTATFLEDLKKLKMTQNFGAQIINVDRRQVSNWKKSGKMPAVRY